MSVGGRLVFLTKDGISIPERKKGDMTRHTCFVLHGVTRLHSGIRYSLFVGKKMVSEIKMFSTSTRITWKVTKKNDA